MITLFFNKFLSILKTYKPYQDLISLFKKEYFPIEISGTQKGLLSFLIHTLHVRNQNHSLIVVPSDKEAENLYQDLSLICNKEESVFLFPWWECIPYSDVSPVRSVFTQRVHILMRLLSDERLLVVTSLRAFLTQLPSPEYLRTQSIHIKKGETLDLYKIAERLTKFGYLRVPRVSVKGEFAVRGEVIDIFVPDKDNAIRAVVEFDEVEEIKLFDPLTQTSIQKLTETIIYPVTEVIGEENLLAVLKESLKTKTGASEDAAASLCEELKINPEMNGAELFYPLCFKKKYSLLDYLKDDSTLFLIDNERLDTNAFSLKKEYVELYTRALSKYSSKAPSKNTFTNNTKSYTTNYIANHIIPRPKDILLDYSHLKKSFARCLIFPGIKSQKQDNLPKIDMKCDPPRSFFGNLPYFFEELENLLSIGYQIFIFAVYDHQAERIKTMLKKLNLNHKLKIKECNLHVLPLSISHGFILPDLKILVIQENEIFGRKKQIPRSIQKIKSQPIDSFIDLSAGDYIVHINYGIGIFKGIERVQAAGNERDYIHLEYAEKETLFIPIEQVNLLQKYVAHDSKKIKLDRIGGKSWQNRKNKVKSSARELAGRLVKLYSERLNSKGFAFPPDVDWQSEFETGFPYQETEDQLKCICEVKQDMEQPYPMDRLVCGDVGYGKTEIALRAAFKAVTGGRQAAMLAPTTILVEQHFENFQERFNNFPVNIAMLSRFRSNKEQKEILDKITSGDVDIVIGTHRLVQKDVRFKNLGLMIIDEEQRFGVKHKERLKELKTSVDCLTLSATPIPRTLHMSLMKIRDMSVLNTPPPGRQSIETFISEFNDKTVEQAIRNEVLRGGQVYYLHNRVETMPKVHSFLQELLPDISIQAAHGQMHTQDLENVMHDFIKGNFQVLLSTTIIENGLDIPNVNTIIIDRADIYGISQLYQLKGRVGRSDVPAYAYLFYPQALALSELAMKRLRIISDFTELGSGFKIALKDLEIRGAGNVLGREQSGDILAVGYDMYIRLLDEAVSELKEKYEDKPPEVYLELEYTGYIPDSYIPQSIEKMEVYKKIASIMTQMEHDRVFTEIDDRFGPPPDEVMSILSISEIRIICRKLFISSLKEHKGVVTVEFAKLSLISIDRTLRLIKESGSRVYLDNSKPNCLCLKTGKIGLKEKSEFLKDQLSRLL